MKNCNLLLCYSHIHLLCKRRVFTLYQVLQMVQYNQIFLHTSYIHIHMGSKTIAKNTKNISPVLGVVCAWVVSPDNDEHVLELGSARVDVED